MGEFALKTIREEVQTLIDHIPDSELPTVREALREFVVPFELALLTAPWDDEPLTQKELDATEQALRREAAGDPPITHEEIPREFGIVDPPT